MSSRRLLKELGEVTNSGVRAYKTVECDEQNLLHWSVLLIPEHEPYSHGAFRISIDFPVDYPFKPPKITFITKIYHPNVGENGQICMEIISPEHWKPKTQAVEVLKALLDLIHNPDASGGLRSDLAQEFKEDRDKFNKAAEEFTKTHAEKRPPR